jgi:hypothetical protein
VRIAKGSESATWTSNTAKGYEAMRAELRPKRWRFLRALPCRGPTGDRKDLGGPDWELVDNNHAGTIDRDASSSSPTRYR